FKQTRNVSDYLKEMMRVTVQQVKREMDFETLPQQPHGGRLVNRVATGEALERALEKAKTLPKIMVDLEAVITIEMIATGVLSTNDGYMNEVYYIAVMREGNLPDGTVWPVPISFGPIGIINKGVICSLSIGDEVELVNEKETPIDILEIMDIIEYDKERRAKYR